jgi:ankyrin repeat protein
MRAAMLMLGMGAAMLASACADPAETSLGAAADRNLDAEIRHLLSSGHGPDEFDGSGMTPLMWASRAGAVDAMRALLDAGADPARVDTRATRWAALMHAVHKRQARAVRVLLERGANPNFGTAAGWTPLIMASADSDPAVAIALLEAGADPRAVTSAGDTALTQAVSGGALADIDRPLLGGCHQRTVAALLAADPNLRLPDTFAGRTARLWARLRRCDAVLSLVR